MTTMMEDGMTDEETAPTKVWICPGCGARYTEPTVCTNQHEPIAADEYDLAPGAEATVEAPVEPAAEPPAPTEAAPSEPAPVADPLASAFSELEDATANLKTKLGL